MAIRCLIVAWLCLAVRSQDDFYFRTNPHNESVTAGQSVQLLCDVSSADRIVLAWTFNKEMIRNTSRRYQEGSSLIIRRADYRLDSGLFECTATNMTSGFSIASLPAALTVQWIGEWTQIDGRLGSGQQLNGSIAHVDEGEMMWLLCAVNGSATMQFEWFHNGRRISHVETQKLAVEEAGAADGGTYTCAASNAAGSARFNVPLVVNVVASMTNRLVNFTGQSVAVDGRSARLICEVENGNAGGTQPVAWSFRGTLLANSSQYVIESDGQLVISNVRRKNEGWYTCSVAAADGRVQEFASHLMVAFLDEFSASSVDPPTDGGNYFFGESSTAAELTCLAPEGVPSAVIWWQGPRGETLTDRTASAESVLSFTRILPEDAGIYSCWAQNSLRNRSLPVNITVTSRPVIEQHPASVSVDEGEEVTMSCSYSGWPSPVTSVSWTKDLRPIAASIVSLQDGRNSTLKLTANADLAGNYVCVVKTVGHAAVASQTAVLNVRGRLKFKVVPVSKKLELGSSSKVHCRAQGSPTPSLRWSREDVAAGGSWPPPDRIQDMNGTLYFHRVQQNDSGYYTCTAANQQGVINATVFLDVIVMPHFTQLPNNVTLSKEGHSVEFHCYAEGQPAPSIQWDKDSVLNGFSFDRFTVNSNGTLRIQDVRPEDEGYYGCTAGNSGGFKRAEFRLLVQGWEYGPDNDRESITKTIVITLGAAGGYILLSLGLLVWCRIKRRLRKTPPVALNDHSSLQTALLTKGEQVDANGGGSSLDKLNVSSASITLGLPVGKGRFGDVHQGYLKAVGSSDEKIGVLVRSMTTRDEDFKTEVRRQVEMFHRVAHVHLAGVVGVVGDSPQLILINSHNLHNLKLHLEREPLSEKQIGQCVLQAARGMNALSQARFVHRDLAARNILIGFKGDDVMLKITTLGLDKEPFTADYYSHKHQVIALRWLPHEAVFEDEYSTKSDVWMFASTVWELNNGAERPFISQTDEAVLKQLSAKSLQWNFQSDLPWLAKCWSHDPKLRPSFEHILNSLESTC